MTADDEGAWAREYRQGRREQVEQQRIANLIAISASPHISFLNQKWAADEALKMLRKGPDVRPKNGEKP